MVLLIFGIEIVIVYMNEIIFELWDKFEYLIIIGGGLIGMEMV